MKKFAEVLNEYEKALIIDPKSLDAEMFNKAIKIDIKNVKALLNKGNTLYELSKFSDAMEYYDKVITIEPKNIDAYFGKGNVYYQIKNYKQAMK